MRKTIDLLNRVPVGVLGGILCGVVYLALFGADELMVNNTDWLMDMGVVGDKGLAYLGTLFYTFSDWQFPTGLSNQLAYPLNYSVVYIDSVPLAALISKIFLSGMERFDFQYLGIVSLLNQVFMGGFSSSLIAKITKSKCAGLLASSFFMINYPYLSRIFVHFGLQAQWLLIALLYFFVWNRSRYLSPKFKFLFYFSFGVLTVWIHSYFLPPMLISIVFAEITYIHSRKDFLKYLGYVAGYISACFLSLYILGGTYGNVIYDTGVIGQQGSNLNTFINPLFHSKICPRLPLYFSGQHNGSVYLGGGILFIIFILVVSWIKQYKGKLFYHMINNLKKYWNLFLGTGAIVIFALSPTVAFNDKVLFELALPDFIVHLWGIFRATGRAMWMVLYIIIVFCICKLFQLYKRHTALFILTFCLCLQLFDYSDFIHSITNKRGLRSHDVYENIMESPVWGQIGQMNKDKIIFMNGADRNNTIKLVNIIGVQRVYEMTRFAFRNSMTVNDFYFARTNQDIGDYRGEIWDQLYKGIADQNAIYIFVEEPVKLIQDHVLNFYSVDGYLIGLAEELQNYEKISPDDEMSIMPLLSTSLKNGAYLDGDRVLYPNGISSGPDIPLNAGKYKLTIYGTNLKNAQLQISADKQCETAYRYIGDEIITADIFLEDNAEHFITLFTNTDDENISIKDIKIQQIRVTMEEYEGQDSLLTSCCR